MNKKRHFRYSRGIQNSGVSEAWYHIIYGIVTNPQRTDQQNGVIKSVCRSIAGDDAEGLYRFLTDQYIDHNYIYQAYQIRPNDLFIYRSEFCREFREQLSSMPAFFVKRSA